MRLATVTTHLCEQRGVGRAFATVVQSATRNQ